MRRAPGPRVNSVALLEAHERRDLFHQFSVNELEQFIVSSEIGGSGQQPSIAEQIGADPVGFAPATGSKPSFWLPFVLGAMLLGSRKRPNRDCQPG